MIEVQFKLAIFTSAAREPEEGPPMFPGHVIEVQFKLEIFTSAARPVRGEGVGCAGWGGGGNSDVKTGGVPAK